MRQLNSIRARALGILVGAVALALAATPATGAAPGSGKGNGNAISAFVPQALLDAAEARPDATFDVILQGTRDNGPDGVAADVNASRAAAAGTAVGVKRQLATIDGVSAELTGKQLLRLATKKDILTITEDVPVALSGNGGYQTAATVTNIGGYSTSQYWPNASHVQGLWSSTLVPPTIAVVDSGIDASRPDFAGRVVASVDLASLTPNSPGDGRGHGTFVAGIAAGAGAGYAGAAPTAKLVSLDVINDEGMALTSDVIAAADWIVQNKDQYGIRVANFSLQESVPSSFLYDPLDKAVEKLWFSGVVVVAAAGNYAVNGARSDVLYAPANDPFVITVGAVDVGGSKSITNDVNAPWSAFGYTVDGFAKPDLAAPGRYMAAAVPAGSTMALEHPERIVAPGYMWMSGTSFAAPVVSGAAAWVLAAHPSWTPDQVKGALMSTTNPLGRTTSLSTGLGEVNAQAAVALCVPPPNPNLALDAFLVPSTEGAPVFDAASWNSAVAGNASWNSASWNSASWNSASWNSASWSSASWNSASWNSTISWTALTWVE